jgi:sugar lactone lactonase YvrE
VRKLFSYLILGILITVIILYAISPIRPVLWQPDADAGLNNMFSVNQALNAVKIKGETRLTAPEDIVISDNGIVYTGLANGDVVSFNVDTPDQISLITNTGGRPLGVRLDNEGNLIVSDAIKGLLKVTTDGEISVLLSEYQGKTLRFIDHHDIAENGDIYFSDASARYDLSNYLHDFLEASATGSIYRYSPSTGETVRIMTDLFFANGVALGPDDAYLLVAETGKSRILKYYLTGPEKGLTTIFANNLPAMPDNLSFNEDGTFWAGMVSLRDWRVESLAPFPELRRILGALPISWFEPKSFYGFVLGFDLNGKVIANFQTADAYTSITSAYEHDGKLYLGSLHSNGIAVMPLEP